MLENAPSPFTAADDNFHEATDHPWQTETCWFCFNVPERAMGSWLHASVRPNLGVATFSIFVWDDSGVMPWELPYFFSQTSQPLPRERDLRDFTWPHGHRVQMLEPLTKYQVTYEDRDLIKLDLIFEGTSAPHPFRTGKPPFDKSPHLDQPGRMYGDLTLEGEHIPVDCFTLRDRSWGPRVDHRSGRIGYSFCTASADEAFCVFVRPQECHEDGSEIVNHGYLVRDGIRQGISSGRRVVERDPEHGWLTRIIIDCEDHAGRPLQAEGAAVSRMMLPSPRGVTVNTLLAWTFNGARGHGEDQDVWRADQWRAARKAGFNDYRP